MVTPQIDEIGRLIGDGSRAAMLVALMDGRAWTGRELAQAAHVAPSTASEHLQRLVDAALLNVVRQGKHRYYRIASGDVAYMLETMMLIAPQVARSPGVPQVDADLRRARTCYDHLAGELGVAIADAIVRSQGIILPATGAIVSGVDHAFFNKLGIAVNGVNGRRPMCRLCMDWTERRFHVSGRLGAALARYAFDQGWIERRDGTRALSVLQAGIAGLREAFNLEWTF